MFKVKSNNYIIIFGLIILSCKCKDKNEPDVVCTEANTVKLPQDAVDRFFFKTGSYWVYKDSLSNLTDSFWVTEHSFGVADLQKINFKSKGKCYEGTNIKYTSTLTVDFNIAVEPSPSSSSSYTDEYFYINQLVPSENLGFRKIRYQGNSIDTLIVIENNRVKTINSLKVDSFIYNNVLCLENNGQGVEKYLSMYYVKNIGLVKFVETKNGRVWELIRYKVIQ